MREQPSNSSDAKMLKHGMKLVYKVIITEEIVFATPGRIKYVARINDAVDHSSTWAEFRHAMPRDEYSRVMLLSFDDKEEPRPKGSDPFNSGAIVPSVSEMDYPPHLEDEMFHGTMPRDIVEQYCWPPKEMCSIDTKDLTEIRTELKPQGHKLTPALEQEMSHGILPSDALGNCHSSSKSPCTFDRLCTIDPKYLDEIRTELKRRGYTLTPALEQEMFHGILPRDILQKYCECELNISGELCCAIDPKYLDEIMEELERRGFEIIDGSDDASFVW